MFGTLKWDNLSEIVPLLLLGGFTLKWIVITMVEQVKSVMEDFRKPRNRYVEFK